MRNHSSGRVGKNHTGRRGVIILSYLLLKPWHYRCLLKLILINTSLIFWLDSSILRGKRLKALEKVGSCLLLLLLKWFLILLDWTHCFIEFSVNLMPGYYSVGTWTLIARRWLASRIVLFYIDRLNGFLRVRNCTLRVACLVILCVPNLPIWIISYWGGIHWLYFIFTPLWS